MSFCIPRSIGASRKDVFEAVMARKKEREFSNMKQWQSHTQYLNNSAMRAEREKMWTSDQAQASSMEYFEAQKVDREAEKIIDNRRRRLRSLFDEEAKQQIASLTTEVSKGSSAIRICKDPRKRCASNEFELARNSLSSNLNNSTAAKTGGGFLENALVSKHYYNLQPSEEEIHNHKTHASSDEQNLAKFEEPVEEVGTGEQMSMAKEAEKLEQQQKRLRFLQDQLEELNQREKEADRLVEEENQLTRILARLDKLELQLCALEDEYKQEFNRRAPLRQHNATLRRRSATIQSELKSQLGWLERFVSQCTQGENSEDKANSDGVKAVRQVIEADLEKEKKFVLDLDVLLGHEAAALWNDKESSWIREASSRYKLLLQLLENRRHNTVARLEEVHRRQREELRSREALLETVEKIRDEQFPKADSQQYQSSQDCGDPPERTVEENQFPHNQGAICKAEKAYEEILRKDVDTLKATEIATLQPTRQRPGLPYPYFKPGGNIW
ncbi:hypothetical protein CRM22_008570 [Opisthorchis felineus]|uniref:Trichoplein keratin filament-binding protein n=1 Tax=Opisthorchis felineus TaxID=147828 RepID=A0A4S2LIJ4_OPIFE|nr:hypothetical protein CRM22_008570 [Opisthorchis felineus]